MNAKCRLKRAGQREIEPVWPQNHPEYPAEDQQTRQRADNHEAGRGPPFRRPSWWRAGYGRLNWVDVGGMNVADGLARGFDALCGIEWSRKRDDPRLNDWTIFERYAVVDSFLRRRCRCSSGQQGGNLVGQGLQHSLMSGGKGIRSEGEQRKCAAVVARLADGSDHHRTHA